MIGQRKKISAEEHKNIRYSISLAARNSDTAISPSIPIPTPFSSEGLAEAFDDLGWMERVSLWRREEEEASLTHTQTARGGGDEWWNSPKIVEIRDSRR